MALDVPVVVGLGLGGQGEEDVVEVAPADLLLEVAGRAGADDDASVEHDDPVRQPVDLLEVLAREQHGRCPPPATSSTSAQTALRALGSRPVVGSSSRQDRGASR